MARAAILLVIVLLTGWTPASAQDVLLRADLPLWTGADGEDFYPKHFSETDGDSFSFGCSSNIQFGDYREVRANDPERVAWWRIGNYGVFHCALLLSEASERTELDTGFREHAWLVVLGKIQTSGGEIELLALQIGARGGSTYNLFSRSVGAPNTTLSVLDPVCPRGSTRRGRGIDVWRTDYCVVASQSALRRIAREAFRRPPVAALEYVGPELDSGSTGD